MFEGPGTPRRLYITSPYLKTTPKTRVSPVHTILTVVVPVWDEPIGQVLLYSQQTMIAVSGTQTYWENRKNKSKQRNSNPSMSMLTIVPVGAGEQRHVFFVLPDNANNLGGMFWKGDCPKDAIVIEFMVNNPVMIIMRILWVYRSL